MPLPVSLLVGFLLASFIGYFAYRRGSLTESGVVGAIVTGTAIFGLGGFIPGALLVAFFVSSTVLSKYQARAKESVNEKFQKGSQRDLGQALANGGWAAVLAVAMAVVSADPANSNLQRIVFSAFVGALATVTADTWATEIGVLSSSLPRMITNGRVVPAGTSGAVTPLGTLTALSGAIFIGIVVVAATQFLFAAAPYAPFNLNVLSNNVAATLPGISIFSIAGVSGFAGSLFDSLLGATVQATYFSEYDERQTERELDSQGSPTRLVRGWRWLNNDWVNFFASVLGSAVAAALAFFSL